MKRAFSTLALVLLGLFNSQLIAQAETIRSSDPKEIDGCEAIYNVCQRMPTAIACENFPPGKGKDWFNQRIRAIIRENLSISKAQFLSGFGQGSVVRCVIDMEGLVQEPRIVFRRDTRTLVEDEILRLFREFPDLAPGRQEGEPVCVYFNFHITREDFED